ncbi:serine hydrolase [Kribbella qitaiheensis]|uniref:serine hydrolase n=1 Tax=Kribbella qitaiheensis TaxID=1544730 RepID=UPI00248446BC|nr:serine hydrolase [Kribbella qitaiheensis]
MDGAPLSAELAREVLTPQISSSERIGGLDALGLGLFLGDGGRIYGHSGSNEGFRCHLMAYRDTGQGAAVMTNGDSGSWVVEKAFVRIAEAHGWKDYPTELEERVVPDDAVMAGRVGTYRLRENLRFKVEQAAVGFPVTFDGQSPMPFRATAPDRLGARTADTELRFDDDGGVVFVQNGEEIRCRRE